MSVLTINEAVLMLAIWRLKDNAYGVAIREKVSEVTEREWNYGTLYCALDQLVKKGMLNKREGEPLPQRGGRRKIFYSLTGEGAKTLQAAHRMHMALWEGISDIAADESLTG